MHTENKIEHHPNQERVPRCIFKGSLTVEAALALPLFFFAVLCLVYLLEMTSIQVTIRSAAHSAAKEAGENITAATLFNPIAFQADLIRLAGSDRLNRSIVVGGSSGVHCYQSYADADGEMHINVTYQVRLPFPQFAISPIKYKESFRIKGWTGYDAGDKEGDGQVVYITDTATVYHEEYQCTYLQLSIQMVLPSEAAGLRNEDGGRYHACEKCGKVPFMGSIYITSYGNKYHNSIRCSGLKRTIYAVPRSSAAGKGACLRCAH